jgi:hypothetical protein
MRPLTIILAFMLLDSCSNVGQIDVDAIRIEKINQHSTFADHDRRLITIGKNQKVIDELAIYPDSGTGCESFLFDSDSKYILIDCNGQWFSIDKATGTLKNDGWKWNEKLPDNALGKFQTSDKAPNYIFSVGTNYKENDVYKYKDPSE